MRSAAAATRLRARVGLRSRCYRSGSSAAQMGITGWIAIAAFLISLVSLMQGMFLAWLKWPRVVVEVEARHGGELNAPASEHRVRTSSGGAFILTVKNKADKAA